MTTNLKSIIFIGDPNANYQELVKEAFDNSNAVNNTSILSLTDREYLILRDSFVLDIINQKCTFNLIEGEDDAIYDQELKIKLYKALNEYLEDVKKDNLKVLLEKILSLLKVAFLENKVIVFFFL